MQVSTFRSLNGIEYSSTFTTSNLRALTVNIFEWRTGHDPASRHRAALLASVIAAFAVGAGVGGYAPGSFIGRPHGSRPLP